MNYYLLLFLIVFSSVFSRAQSTYKPNLQEPKTVEGTYEYLENTTLEIAASPKDTLLYALIGTSKYKLRPFEKDIFLNSTNQQVQFVWNGTKIIGYKVKDDQPDKVLLTTRVNFSHRIWYARPPSEKYKYVAPKQQNDGLTSESLATSGLDTSQINKMIERIIDGTYANVHSILLVKDGKLILEEYFYEYDQNSLHELRSATKTFISSLVGIANAKGFIKTLDDSVKEVADTIS